MIALYRYLSLQKNAARKGDAYKIYLSVSAHTLTVGNKVDIQLLGRSEFEQATSLPICKGMGQSGSLRKLYQSSVRPVRPVVSSESGRPHWALR